MSHSEKKSRRALIPIYALLCSLTVLGRFITLPLPIPITMQFAVTNTSALLLGRRGVIPPLLYTALGLIGLPVFTSGGGLGCMLEPTFGFIPGLVLGALVTGFISEKRHSTAAMALASAAGLVCVYLCGTVYYALLQRLYFAAPVDLTGILGICILPFILPDAAKCTLSIFLYKKLTRHIKIQPTDHT